MLCKGPYAASPFVSGLRPARAALCEPCEDGKLLQTRVNDGNGDQPPGVRPPGPREQRFHQVHRLHPGEMRERPGVFATSGAGGSCLPLASDASAALYYDVKSARATSEGMLSKFRLLAYGEPAPETLELPPRAQANAAALCVHKQSLPRRPHPMCYYVTVELQHHLRWWT